MGSVLISSHQSEANRAGSGHCIAQKQIENILLPITLGVIVLISRHTEFQFGHTRIFGALHFLGKIPESHDMF